MAKSSLSIVSWVVFRSKHLSLVGKSRCFLLQIFPLKTHPIFSKGSSNILRGLPHHGSQRGPLAAADRVPSLSLGPGDWPKQRGSAAETGSGWAIGGWIPYENGEF